MSGERYERVAFAVMFVAFAAAPFAIYPNFGMQLLCFALFACAFNLLIGFGGLLSFGHAMFFGMGSYLAAQASAVWGLPIEVAILTGTAMATALGVVSGFIAIRRQGIYFAMITLALAQMVYFFCLRAPFTGGENGIQGVPRGKLLGMVDLNQPLAMYYFVFAIFIAGFLLIHRIIHSPFGQVLKAIRENESRAVSLGYRAERYKLVAFVLSASLAGLAGATKAMVTQNASLTDVYWAMSGEVVLMTLLGGMGTVFGPVVGAMVIISMQLYLAELGSWVTIVQGVIFVICVLAFRRGIVGEIEAWLRGRIARLEPEPGQPPAAHAGGFPAPCRRGLSRQDRRDPWRAPPHVSRIRGALRPARLGAGRARRGPRRNGGHHGAQRAGAAGSPLRRAGAGRGRERAQLPARCRDHRVLPRAWRRQGAHHRPRVLRHRGRSARSR